MDVTSALRRMEARGPAGSVIGKDGSDAFGTNLCDALS